MERLKKRFFVVVLVLALLMYFGSLDRSTGFSVLPAECLPLGDWNIIEDVTCSDGTIIVNGDISVSSSASLTLRNITLLFGAGDYMFDVGSNGGGEVIIVDSVIGAIGGRFKHIGISNGDMKPVYILNSLVGNVTTGLDGGGNALGNFYVNNSKIDAWKMPFKYASRGSGNYFENSEFYGYLPGSSYYDMTLKNSVIRKGVTLVSGNVVLNNVTILDDAGSVNGANSKVFVRNYVFGSVSDSLGIALSGSLVEVMDSESGVVFSGETDSVGGFGPILLEHSVKTKNTETINDPYNFTVSYSGAYGSELLDMSESRELDFGFSFALPNVTDLYIEPLFVHSGSDLSSVWVSSGNELESRNRWFVNGDLVGDGSALGRGNFSRGDTITLEFVPVSDGIAGFGVNYSVDVMNSPPEIIDVYPESNVSIEDGTLLVFSVNYSDDDGDDVFIEWSLNNESLDLNLSMYEFSENSGEHIVGVELSDGLDVSGLYWDINISSGSLNVSQSTTTTTIVTTTSTIMSTTSTTVVETAPSDFVQPYVPVTFIQPAPSIIDKSEIIIVSDNSTSDSFNVTVVNNIVSGNQSSGSGFVVVSPDGYVQYLIGAFVMLVLVVVFFSGREVGKSSLYRKRFLSRRK